MGIENKKIYVELKGQEIKSELKSNFLETITDFRTELDCSIDDIRLKESIINDISKNYYRFFNTEIQAIEEKRIKLSERNEDLKDLSVEEWNNTLKELLIELRQVVKNNFPNLWDCLEFQLAIKNILHINKCNLPFAGIILGAPSSINVEEHFQNRLIVQFDSALSNGVI